MKLLRNDCLHRITRLFPLLSAGSLIAALLITGCSGESSGGPRGRGEPVVPAVEAVQASFGSLPLTERLSGVVKARNQVELYSQVSAEVVEVTLSPMDDFHAAGFMISATERLAAYETMATEAPEKFGQRYRDRMILGSFVTGADYVQALRMRRELTVEVVTKMAGIDVLLTAANPGEAPKIDALPRFENLKKPSFTMPFNLTGLPAMSICGGFGPTGLPLGLQLVAKPFQEALLFRAAHAYEQATEWRSRRPEPVMAVAA